MLLLPSAICDNIVDEPVRRIGLDVLEKKKSYLVGLALISIVPVRDVQSSNVLYISVTLFGIAGAVVSEVQPENVKDILVTPFGIAGAVLREVQFMNVHVISVTLLALLAITQYRFYGTP